MILTVDIDAELRTELINMANEKGISLNNYVIDAINLQLNYDKGYMFAEKNVAQSKVTPEEASRILQEFIAASGDNTD
jgi:hypothetical protein